MKHWKIYIKSYIKKEANNLKQGMAHEAITQQDTVKMEKC